MCFFNSLAVSAAAIAKKYGKRLDIIEATKQILAENEAAERAAQEKNPAHKPNIYNFRLAEKMYSIPAYAEPRCVIVSGSENLQVMQWGLIPRSSTPADRDRYNKKNLYKNARGETIFDKWPWRFLWKQNRCIIPSTGFYEPHYYTDKKSQPYFITIKERPIFPIAGLWDEWKDPDTGETLKSFVLLTVAANPFMRNIHNGGNNPYRMPLIFTNEQAAEWLNPLRIEREELEPLITVYPEAGLQAHPVRNNFHQDDPYDAGKIEPVPEACDQKLDL